MSIPRPLGVALGYLGALAGLGGIGFFAYRSLLESPFRGQIVESAQFSRDGKILFGTGYLSKPETTEFYLYAWETDTGHLRWKKPLSPEGVGELSVSHDGKHLLTTQYGVLTLYDATTGSLVRKIPFPEPKNVLVPRHNSAAQFIADDKEILVCNLNDTLMALDTATGKQLRTFKHRPQDQGFALSPDGTQLALFEKETLLLLDPKTEKTLLAQSTKNDTGLRGVIYPVRYFPDGKLVRVADQVWNPAVRGLRPLNRDPKNSEYDEFITSPDQKQQADLEYQGGKGVHYPLGTIKTRDGKNVTLEGKTGW
ncbi:PQQ-binding-like beta-propeller repeat protein [Armatimonas sp.]|uniref:WD40 repeat domain-containing protein n=1 Tax=Armatimonas sp. TaxID=1872638 RepID=UPI00286CE695|nr:PQQ-binding-like beta-propeller repeat protein [Armatimonas sp.]